MLQQRLAWHQLLLLLMPSVSRSKTANSRNSLYLLVLKSFLLQRFKTWQEAGAVYLPRGSQQPQRCNARKQSYLPAPHLHPSPPQRLAGSSPFTAHFSTQKASGLPRLISACQILLPLF